MYLLIDDKPVGAIALADVIRKESFDAIARLKAMGIRCLMITGDATAVAKSVAARLGLTTTSLKSCRTKSLRKSAR